MAFAPEKGHFEAYETYRKERPKSATVVNDVYGTKSIANTPSAAESAFLIMKKIHTTTGEPLPTRGRSLFENLQYIKTEPSVKVLKKTPWRQYFQEIGTTDPTLVGKDLSPKIQYKEKNNPSYCLNQTNEINFPKLFEQLVKRVQNLWRELHIPDSDRDFYSYSLLQGPYHSPKQIDEITRYIKVLHQYRNATVNVLKVIRKREEYVLRCIELFASARRNSSLKFISIQEGIERKAEIIDHNQQLAREIQESLQLLQQASLLVGEKVKLWRQCLWRPHAFVYQGQNYLLKMSSDMDLLKTDSTKRILENLNILTTIDLNGIIFPSEIETGLSLLSQLSVTLRESVDVPQVEGIGTTEGSSEGQPLISPEIDELNTLIREEATLQRALSLESKALMTRGSFIPLLKYDMGPPVAKEPSDEIV